MAKRYWNYGINFGFPGCDASGDIDLCDLGLSETEVEDMSELEAEEAACEYARERMLERVDYWATPKDEAAND